ncbi:MAG: EamA family transporter [Cyanobacteria bacterium SID2]|nr:EamA family transporter [Cyanobacteria bacterium SID2]MBP0002760.1 EamA family transporter [Cyanobacteria bacterium SBC]
MSPQELALFLVSILTNTVGQFLLKAGALKLGTTNPSSILSFVVGVLATPELLFGLAFYGFGAMAYILLLTRVNLSVAGPATALAYVTAVLIGHFVFKESLPLDRLFGIALIICGVLIVVSRR